jgi:hypothetical protein
LRWYNCRQARKVFVYIPSFLCPHECVMSIQVTNRKQ